MGLFSEAKRRDIGHGEQRISGPQGSSCHGFLDDALGIQLHRCQIFESGIGTRFYLNGKVDHCIHLWGDLLREKKGEALPH